MIYSITLFWTFRFDFTDISCVKREFLAMCKINLAVPMIFKKKQEIITQANTRRKEKTKQEVPFTKNDLVTTWFTHLDWKAL